MKKNFMDPETDVVRFDAQDIITKSNEISYSDEAGNENGNVNEEELTCDFED